MARDPAELSNLPRASQLRIIDAGFGPSTSDSKKGEFLSISPHMFPFFFFFLSFNMVIIDIKELISKLKGHIV